MLKKSILAVALSGVIATMTGCASNMNAGRLATRTAAAVAQQETAQTAKVVKQYSGPYLAYQRVALTGDVTANLQNADFVGAIEAIASRGGYSVTVMGDVNRSQTVDVSVRNLSTEAAIRQIAYAAGYVAVVNHSDHTVTLAKTATYTFRVPTSVLRQISTNMTVGGNPVAMSGTGSTGSAGGMTSTSSGSSTGTSSSGGSIQSTFVVSGKYDNNSKAIQNIIEQTAGPNASVNIVPELGLITVRSNAEALRRVHDFLKSFCKDAMTRVQIQAAIVDVELNHETQYGINWKHVLDAAGTTSFSLSTASIVGSPAGAATLTTASTSALINALRTITNVKVVSEPKLVTMNHMPAVLFDGTQIPYVPDVTSTVTGTSGTAQNSASGAYATDGLSLDILPDILSSQDVQISVVPVMSTINGMQTFNLGGGATITMPEQDIKQSFVETLGQNGKTLIIAGSRYRSTNDSKNGLPGIADIPLLGTIFSGVDNTHADRELIIMLHTDIIPAPHFDPLVSASV